MNRITGISLTDVQEDQRQIASDMDQLGREAQINKAKAEQEAKNADSEGNGLIDIRIARKRKLLKWKIQERI